MSYQFLDHPADVRVACRGSRLEDVFTSAAEALYALALRRRRRETSIRVTVDLAGDGAEDVLVRWLQDLIYRLETDHFVAARMVFERLDAQGLCARLAGYRCAAEERETEVKAATYHGMAVQRVGDGYSAEILFDL